jgi:hypothetical protein
MLLSFLRAVRDLSSLYAVFALPSLNIVTDLTSLCVLYALYSLNIIRGIYSLYVLRSQYSVCVLFVFTLVLLSPATTEGSSHSTNFCRFDVVLKPRSGAGLMIILKEGYSLHSTNTQTKYASSENSVSRTLHLHTLFHLEYALFSLVHSYLLHLHVYWSNLMAGNQFKITPKAMYSIQGD